MVKKLLYNYIINFKYVYKFLILNIYIFFISFHNHNWRQSLKEKKLKTRIKIIHIFLLFLKQWLSKNITDVSCYIKVTIVCRRIED